MKKFKTLTILLPAALLTFLLIRMFTAPTDLELATTFVLPDFPSLTEALPQNLTEKYAIAIDGELAYANNSESQPTASTAKMLLALMVMEKRPFALGETGETIEITQEFYNLYTWYIANGGSYTPVQIGEQISEYDALASALLPSSNNMADTLAIWAFGNLENYRAYATKRLQDWGITGLTVGTDASGFSETTTASAATLALLGQKLMENPVLAEIVSKKSQDIPVAGTIKNTNQLLGTKGIIGIKTGFIGDPSGYCLVSAYREGDHLITLAVLDAPTRADSFTTSEVIISTLQDNVKDALLATSGTEIGYYNSWWNGQTPIRLESDASALGWQDATQSITLDIPSAPNASSPSGVLSLTLGNTSYAFPVSAENLQPAPSLWDRFLYAIYLK